MKILKGAVILFWAVFFLSGCATQKYAKNQMPPADDGIVSAEVKDDVIKDTGIKPNEVRVRTFLGQVQLSGFVNSPEQKSLAAKVALRVPGVRVVRNDLIVKSRPPAAVGQIVEPAGAQR